MEVKLVVVGGKSAGREIPVAVPKFFIGRAPECQLRPGSNMVSRHHCVLVSGDAVLAVRDFGSTNGTLVNGQRVEGGAQLNDGDRLKVGPLELEVRMDLEEASDGSAGKPRKDVSEASKDQMRRSAAIVGVSKAAQAKRLTETTRDAAADALKKFFD